MERRTALTGWPPLILWAVGLVLVAVAYLTVFVLTRDRPPSEHFTSLVRNMVPLVASAWIVRIVLVRWALRLKGRALWAVQLPLAFGFSLLWAFLLNVTSALIDAGSLTRFTVAPVLSGPAITWQMLQGLFAYAAIAALTALEHRPAGGLIVISDAGSAIADRFLLRSEDELVTLLAQDIVSVTGADDYAELVTTRGRHLVGTTLAQFDQLLPGEAFVRVHRSAIANLRHVAKAEPTGGGRMVLRMAEGPDLPVSRAGAKLLRERAL